MSQSRLDRMVFRLVTLLLVLPLAMLAGCGGSGKSVAPSSGTNDSNTEGTVQSFGSLTTRVVGAAQAPIASGGVGSIVTGIAGASFTSLVQNRATVKNLTNTRIAYSDYDGGGISQIFTMAADGSTSTQVTTGNTGKYSPVYSPDGTKIAYHGIDNIAIYQIFTIPATGGTRTQITTGNTNKFYPAYAPNGTRIVYCSQDSRGYLQLFTVPVNGGTPTQITTGDSLKTNPCYSPDSSTIAFRVIDSSGINQIYTIPASGGIPTQITTGHLDKDLPTYSPDGTKIAFSGNTGAGYNQIFMMSAFGGGLTQITTGNSHKYDPTFSPDGTTIAFPGDSSAGVAQLFSVPASGGNVTQITSGSTNKWSPSWSPYLTAAPVTLIGTGGSMTTGAAGFLFGQKGDDVLSILTFDTAAATLPSRSTARIASITNADTTVPNLLFNITSNDSLSSLRYLNNDANSTPGKVVIVPLAVGTTGALASFNATTGKVATVLPYAANRSVGKLQVEKEGTNVVVRGHFSGVYNGDGNNAAPDGATVVHLNAATGELVSAK